MAKQIKDENGNTYVQKKPFYKRVWFIILVVIVALVIGGSMVGDKDEQQVTKSSAANSSQTSSSQASSSESSKEVTKDFKVGETATFQKVDFNISNVQFTDGDPDVDTPDDGKQYVVATITITNNSDESYDYTPADFQLDDNGNQTDFDDVVSTVNNDLDSGSLKPGASVTGTLVGQANPNDKLKATYSGSVFSDDENFNFQLN